MLKVDTDGIFENSSKQAHSNLPEGKYELFFLTYYNRWWIMYLQYVQLKKDTETWRRANWVNSPNFLM